MDALRAQQEKLIKDLGELMEKNQSSSEAAAKLAIDQDAVERDLQGAVNQRTKLVEDFKAEVAVLSDELTFARDQLELEKGESLKLRNEIVSIKYSSFETLEATKKLLIETQEKYKMLETDFLRVQKASDERKAKAEAEMNTAREACKLLKKESEVRLTAIEFELAEAESKNVALNKECKELRSRVADEAAVAEIGLVDTEKHDPKTEANNMPVGSMVTSGSSSILSEP